MKITQDIGIRICGTGSSVPERKISNDDMATIVETNDEWIRTRTGISNRHFADKETNLSLGMEAAEKALEMAGISKEEIGVVICATITPDNIVPSQACMLQKELGLPETVFAFDICAACTGFLYAVHTARSLLCSMPEKKYALVVASEVLSRVTNFADRNTCVLFGDGAGAAVITLDENSRYALTAEQRATQKCCTVRSIITIQTPLPRICRNRQSSLSACRAEPCTVLPCRHSPAVSSVWRKKWAAIRTAMSATRRMPASCRQQPSS